MRQKIAFTSLSREGYIDKKGIKHQKSYTIRIRNYTEIKKMNKLMNDFEIKKNLKQEPHKTIWIENGYMYYPIHKVEKEPFKGKVYNLEVEGVHSYLCENATLHNCLSKDLSVLQKMIKKLKVNCPLINSISKSNDIQKQRDKK